MWLWILFGLSIMPEVRGYSDGNFPQSCESMLPQHDGSEGLLSPQTTEPPFEVSFQFGNKKDPITVFLSSKSSAQFRGFLLEARRTDKGDSESLVGKFTLLQNDVTRLLACRDVEDSAVSKRGNVGFSSMKVNWTAPEDAQNITFRATFVQEYSIFWEPVDINLNLLLPTTQSPRTTQPSTSTSTTVPSTTTNTTVASTTVRATVAGAERTTTMTSTTVKATMTGAARTTTMTSTTVPSSPRSKTAKAKVAALSSAVTALQPIKTGLHYVFMNTLVRSPVSHNVEQGSRILCSLLCFAVEIAALVFSVGVPIHVTLVALVAVVIVINFIELAIICLPVGPSHELKEIHGHAVKLCSVIIAILANAITFIGVWEIVPCEPKWKESWLLKVMIAYTVWIFLFVVWVFVFGIYKNTTQKKKKKQGNSERSMTCSQEKTPSRDRKKKKHRAAVVVPVILILGSISLAAAVIAGIYYKKGACR